MIIKNWVNLPTKFQNPSVKLYYDQLKRKKISYCLKYIFDRIFSLILFVFLIPIFLIISIIIKNGSPGPIFFKQNRITQSGREFKIIKFRTMIINNGANITENNDHRITKNGKFLRKFRIDEIPQLINIIKGDMSFVGTRPEVKMFVDNYTDEMLATLLMPAGVTSRASIYYKDEDEILKGSADIEKEYLEKILPEKMKYNLESLIKFSLVFDFLTIIKTLYVIMINKKSE